jgi:hypothetical protein
MAFVEKRVLRAKETARLCFDDLISYGVTHELAYGVELELSHDVGTVGLSGFDTDAEGDGDLFATLTFGKELNNFAFARCEAIAEYGLMIGNGVLFAEAIQQHVCGARGEEGTMIRKSFDSSHEIAIGIGLHDVRAHTCLDDVADELIGKMKRENKNFGSGELFADAPGGLKTVQLRHTDVHDHDVRLKLLGHRDGLSTSLGLCTNIPAGMGSEELLQSPPDDVVIVRD